MASKDEIARFLAGEFPQMSVVLEAVGPGSAIVRREIGPADLRPGGTVSGPVMMELADLALYVALLGAIGIVPLAVTTNLNINFLRKPSAHKDLLAQCKLIKLGKTLAVGEVSIYSEGSTEAVAHVVGTYAIPAARSG